MNQKNTLLMNGERNPLVSIYIPTYNRIDLLKRAINSVLSQSYSNIELIVVDDGSTDGTVDYLSKLSEDDERVNFIKKTGSRGAPSSRNIAIFNASGKYITGLDDDDYLEPGYIEKLYSEYDYRYSCVFARRFNWKDCFFSPVVFFSRVLSFDSLVFFNIIGNQVFTETSRMKEIGGFKVGLEAAQDYEAWLRLLNRFGSAKMIYYSGYNVDTSHELGRISDDRRRAIATYNYISEQYGFEKKSKEAISMNLRCYAISSEGRFPWKACFYPKNYRHLFSVLRKKLSY
jgi:glycosyltransferase involved in cell wall biosynthesis